MTSYQELDTIRLLEVHEGPGHYSLGDVHRVPAGAVGTVLVVFDDGAMEVEFTVREPEFDGDKVLHPGTFHVITLKPSQVTPA